MKALMRYVLVAAAATVVTPAVAAPLTPAERSTFEARELHEARDMRTGDFRGHTERTSGKRGEIKKDFPSSQAKQTPVAWDVHTDN